MPEKKTFRVRLPVSLSLVFPPIIIALFLTTAMKSLPFPLPKILFSIFAAIFAVLFLFLVSHLGKITVDEEKITYFQLQLFANRQISIKWEDIKAIKTRKISSTVLLSTGIPRKRFIIHIGCSRIKTIGISRNYSDFENLLKLVLARSTNALVAPEVRKLLGPPDNEKINKVSRRYGFLFILVSVISAYLFAMISESNTLSFFYIFIIYMVLVNAIGLGAVWCFHFLYAWYGDRCLFVSNIISTPSYFMNFIFLLTILSGNFMIILWMSLIITVIALTMGIFLLNPKISGKAMLSLSVFMAAMFVYAGSVYLPKIQKLATIDNFFCSNIAWFPDDSKILVEGMKINKTFVIELSKSLILDTDGNILKTLPSIYSDYWTSDGTRLAFVAYPSCKLLVLDTQSLETKELLETKHIFLQKYGCWNKNGTKLVVSHSNEEGNHKKIEWTVSVIDAVTAESKVIWKGYNNGASFWLSDDTPGSLLVEEKGDGLFRYSIIRIHDNGKTETVYTCPENCQKRVKISPHGRYMISRNQQNNIIVADVLKKKSMDAPAGFKTDGYDSYWAPDEKGVLVCTDGKIRFYDTEKNQLIELLADVKGYKSFLNWSPDLCWIIASAGDFMFPCIFLVSKDGKEKILIGRIGGMTTETASLNRNNNKLVTSRLTYSFKDGIISPNTTPWIYPVRRK